MGYTPVAPLIQAFYKVRMRWVPKASPEGLIFPPDPSTPGTRGSPSIGRGMPLGVRRCDR